MSEDVTKAEGAAAAVSEDRLRKAEAYVEAEDGVVNRLVGWAGTLVTSIAVTMSLFHLYAAIAGAWPFTDFPIITTQPLRYAHVAFVMMLCFLLFPMSARFRNHIRWWDVVAGITGAAILIYAIEGGEEFTDRATMPTHLDVVLGVVFIVLLLEATRRTTGWIVPCVAIAFMAYAYFGPYLPPPWTHRGYDVSQLVGHLFITLEGIFGIPVDVSSSLIILFTIYGAFLQHSGAGKFFIDFSMALMGHKANSAGRTVVLSSFLLGGPSGSGVATTVTIGAVAYPLMQRAGFEKNAAGGLLAAGGLGAIISPPVLGAAAFLIAEFLKISYLDVIWMAIIPTCLYYLSLLFMVELDAKRFHAQTVNFEQQLTLAQMTRRYGFHFISLVSIVIFMLWGYSPTLSVFWSTVLTYGAELSHPRDRDHAEEAGARIVRRLDQRAHRGDHLRDRRHHRRRRHPDRARTQVLLDRDRLRRRQPAADRDLHRADRVDRRPGGAGDRLLHHLRRDRGARHDQARRAGLRRAHVHLLLFGAVGSVAADRALAVRRRRDHRRRSLPDHAAGVEVHAARLPGPVRIRARPARHRLAAQAAEGRLVDRHRSDHGQDRARPGGAGGGGARLGAAQDDHGRAPAAGAGRPVPGVSEPARSADGDHDRPRHQLHRDIWLGDRHRSPAKTAHAAGSAQYGRPN